MMDDAAIETDVPEERRLTATVELVEALGSDLVVHALVDAPPVRTTQTAEAAESDIEEIGHRRRHPHRGPLRPQKPGQDRRRRRHRRRHHPPVQFFDLDTGLAIWD